MLDIRRALNADGDDGEKRQPVISVFNGLRAREQGLNDDQRFTPEQEAAFSNSLRLLQDEEELFGDDQVNFIADTYRELRGHVSQKELENLHRDDMDIDPEENQQGPLP
jgi:hypothetical protein